MGEGVERLHWETVELAAPEMIKLLVDNFFSFLFFFECGAEQYCGYLTKPLGLLCSTCLLVVGFFACLIYWRGGGGGGEGGGGSGC